MLSIRQFKRGGELFIDALSTFTAVELISYNDFVALTVIANTLTLKRVDLKKKVRISWGTHIYRIDVLRRRS
jgi:26S proteasome regulatory subunit N7